MSRLGDITRDATRNALARLFGKGGYTDDPGGPHDAELTGIAYAYAAAAEKVEAAFREAFPGLASELIEEWESFLQIGDDIGRTEAQRSERLRYFNRLTRQLTKVELRNALKLIDTSASNDRVTLADAVAGKYHPQLIAFTPSITVSSSSSHVLRMVRELTERAVSPNDWPMHINGQALKYDTETVEGEAAFSGGLSAISSGFREQFYGPQFYPGKSEIADDLNGLYSSLFQSYQIRIDATRASGEDPVGVQMLHSGNVAAASTVTIDTGQGGLAWAASLTAAKEGWNSRIIEVWGRVHTAGTWKQTGTVGTYVRAVGWFASTTATNTVIQLRSSAGALVGINLICNCPTTGAISSLQIQNTNGSIRYMDLWIRATPVCITGRSGNDHGKSFGIRKGRRIKFSTATDGLGEDIDFLRQAGPVWVPNSGISEAFGADPECVRRYGIINNMRKPTSGTNVYTLDSSVDWRDRYILVSWGFRLSQANGTDPDNKASHYPGAASLGATDTMGYGRRGLSPGANPHLFYAGNAGAGYTLYSDDSDTFFLNFTGEIYADATTGNLMIRIPSGDSHLFTCISMSFLVHATCRIDSSEVRDHSVTSYSTGNTLDVTEYRRIGEQLAMLPFHEPVPKHEGELDDQMNLLAGTYRSQTMPVGPITAGQGHVPVFLPRRLRVGDAEDSVMLVRQNNWGEVHRMFSFFVPNTNEISVIHANHAASLNGLDPHTAADQIDMRDRICHLMCVPSTSDYLTKHSGTNADDDQGVHFYTWVDFGKGNERVIYTDLWGISGLDLVIQGLRSPNVAELFIRNNTGSNYYFTGCLWASPQLGCADTRR